jgi:nucleotide-binding universal stress UspA family protein
VAETSLRKILLATDGSKDATLATRIATDLSSRTEAELHVAHAWHSVASTRFESFIRISLKQEARQLLSEQVERIKAQGSDVTGVHLREGPAVDEMLDLAEEIDADLMVVGSRGLGPMKRLALGSISEGIVHHSSRPVFVARGGDRAWPPVRIVVGDDGSEDAKRAGELAAGIGSLFGAEGLLVRAPTPFHLEVSREGKASQLAAFHKALREEAKDLKRRASKLEGVLGRHVRSEIIEGDAALAIVNEAERGAKPTLVAVGSRGSGPIDRMRLGSVSTKVVRAAEEPVLVCPHGEREGRWAIP